MINIGKHAKLGDIIVISAQELRNKARITSEAKKGEICKASVIRTKKSIKKKMVQPYVPVKNKKK